MIALLIGLIVYLLLLWVKHLLIAAVVVFKLLFLLISDAPFVGVAMALALAIVVLATRLAG